MFELSVALKYLIPRRRQLSVSIIALLSVVVISLVVWLVVVFLSVTQGIERRWVETLVSLNAPVRLTPTDEYYQSYYYLVDAHSETSNYTPKTIREKWLAELSDPFDPNYDAELPSNIPPPDLDSEGRLRDPVKGAFAIITGIEGATGRDYEAALGSLRLKLLRRKGGNLKQRFMTQLSFLNAFDEENAKFGKTMLPVTEEDLTQYLELASVNGSDVKNVFRNVAISQLKIAEEGWILPTALYPGGKLKANCSGRYAEVSETGTQILTFEKGRALLDGEVVQAVILPGGTTMDATLDVSSLEWAENPDDVVFDVTFSMQGVAFAGKTPYRHLEVATAEVLDTLSPPWLHCTDGGCYVLPNEGILLAKSYKKQGVHIGDNGHISYFGGSPGSVEEQRIPIYVAGFYDPGLTPAAAKFVFVDREVTADIRGAMSQLDPTQGTGINVWFDDVSRADAIRDQVVANLEAEGIDHYWTVETYKDYPFAKPLIEQFQSDRMIFSLIAVIIIIVACSNIISMLILLVNDKRREIGILRAMGASARSVAGIFAFCGTVMGVFGSLIGIVGALFTLRHLDRLVSLLSAMQGHEAFNEAFFGGDLPNQLSGSVLGFVVGATIVVSLLAGLIPAIKATLIKPSAILRGQ